VLLINVIAVGLLVWLLVVKTIFGTSYLCRDA